MKRSRSDTAIADACTYQVIGSVNHGDETVCEPVISYPDLGKVYVLNGFLDCKDGGRLLLSQPYDRCLCTWPVLIWIPGEASELCWDMRWAGVKIVFSLKREYRDCTVTFSPFVSPAESDTSDLAADVIADCRTGIVPDWQSTPLIFSDSCNRIYAGTERIIRFSGSFFGEVPTLERWTGCAVYDMRRKETAWEDRKVEGNREDRKSRVP